MTQSGQAIEWAEKLLEGEKMKDKLCVNCKFWDPTAPTREEAKVGECRRYPPFEMTWHEDGKLFVGFPDVRSEDWCGEWEFASAYQWQKRSH